MLTICKRVWTKRCLLLVETISLFKKQCYEVVQQSYLLARQMAKTYSSAITFKERYEIINYGQYFNQLQTVLRSNCFANCQYSFAKCLNQMRDCSSWIEYCLNYNEVCLNICRLFKNIEDWWKANGKQYKWKIFLFVFKYLIWTVKVHRNGL